MKTEAPWRRSLPSWDIRPPKSPTTPISTPNTSERWHARGGRVRRSSPPRSAPAESFTGGSGLAAIGELVGPSRRHLLRQRVRVCDLATGTVTPRGPWEGGPRREGTEACSVARLEISNYWDDLEASSCERALLQVGTRVESSIRDRVSRWPEQQMLAPPAGGTGPPPSRWGTAAVWCRATSPTATRC